MEKNLLIYRMKAPPDSINDHPKPAKIDLDKKSFPKQKTTQNFTSDAQGFRKTKNENPPTWEI